jgi:hypothetical protein
MQPLVPGSCAQNVDGHALKGLAVAVHHGPSDYGSTPQYDVHLIYLGCFTDVNLPTSRGGIRGAEFRLYKTCGFGTNAVHTNRSCWKSVSSLRIGHGQHGCTFTHGQESHHGEPHRLKVWTKDAPRYTGSRIKTQHAPTHLGSAFKSSGQDCCRRRSMNVPFHHEVMRGIPAWLQRNYCRS